MTGAEFSQDGSRVLTWSDDHTVRVWDANNGSQLVQLKHGDDVAGASFDQQQRRVLTWCADDSVRLWDVRTGNQLVEFQGAGRGAAFSRDESRVLSWGGGEPVRLSNAETGEVLVEFPHAAGNAAFNRDVRPGADLGPGHRRLWDAATGQAIGLFPYQENMNFGPAFHPDGGQILSWNGDSAMVWGVPAKKKLVEFAHQGPVKGAVLNQDESRLLTWNDSDEARWWDLRTGQLLATFPGHAVMNPGGSRLLIRSGDAVKVLDAVTGETVVELKHGGELQGAELSPDASRVLSWGGAAGRMWDAQTGRLLLEHSGINSDARFSPDAGRVLGWTSQLKSSIDYESRLSAWDAKTGRRLCECELAGEIRARRSARTENPFSLGASHPSKQPSRKTKEPSGCGTPPPASCGRKFDSGAVDGAEFNSDGSRVWSWGHCLDETHTMRVFSWATLWDAATGNRLLRVDHDAGMEGPLFNRDRSRIVSWRWALEENWGDQLRLLDARTGQALVEFAGGGRVLGATWNSDETRLLTWSDDAARLWDATTGSVLFEHKYPGSSFGAKFSRDGSRLLCWSGKAACLWDGRTGEELVPSNTAARCSEPSSVATKATF